MKQPLFVVDRLMDTEKYVPFQGKVIFECHRSHTEDMCMNFIGTYAVQYTDINSQITIASIQSSKSDFNHPKSLSIGHVISQRIFFRNSVCTKDNAGYKFMHHASLY